VKHGSVYQRHLTVCPRATDGTYLPHRCRGAWAYIVDLGRGSNGKRQQIGKGGFPTKSAARVALREAAELLTSDVTMHSLTLGDYLDTWLEGKHNLRPKTIAGYRDAIDLYLRPGLGHIRLLELRAHHLDRFYVSIHIGRRGRPLSPSSIRRVHAALRSALNTAVRRRLIPYNPALHVELAPENPKRPTPWTAEQCRAFLRHISQDRLRAVYHLLIGTGMRRGEAIGLRWLDVDLDGGELTVVQQITEVRGKSVLGKPKTRRGRRVMAIDDGMVAALRSHHSRQLAESSNWATSSAPAELVFTREDGSAVRPEYATRHFQALTRAAGLPQIRLHDLRHTNASIALDAGIAMKVVSDRLGHSTIGVTADLYTHVVPRVAREAAQKLGLALESTADEAAAYETFTSGPDKEPEDGADDPDAPDMKKAPNRVCAGQGPAP